MQGTVLKMNVANDKVNKKAMINRFLLSQDVKEGTKQSYKENLRYFFNWLEDTGRINWFYSLKREDILQYKSYLQQEQEYSPYTISAYLTAVRKLIKWLVIEELINKDITEGIKNPKKPDSHSRDSLTDNQVKNALNSFNMDTLKGKRDFAMFNLAVRTGLRTCEISRADIGDLRQKAGEPILWIQGKGRDTKDQYVVLTDKALQPINDYLAQRQEIEEEQPLFTSTSNRNKGGRVTAKSISRIIKKVLKSIGLQTKRYTAHSLRHTTATKAIDSGASIYQVQKMLRHKDSKTTNRYLHDKNRIENACEKLIDF